MNLKRIGNRILLLLFILSFALPASGCESREDLENAYDVYGSPAFRGTAEVFAEGENVPLFAADLCVGGIENSDLVLSTDADADTAAAFLPEEQEITYAKNIYERRYPASTTKILTAYVALKYGDLNQVITVPESAFDDIEYDSSVCGLSAGDQITLSDLLYGLLLESGNDAANTIAEAVGGSREDFVGMMNEEALALGATQSHFVNPHGLPDDDHYTTAYDMYLIFSAAISYDEFVDIISTTRYEVSYLDAEGETIEQEWTNTNAYLTGEYGIPDGVTVVGGKTGTTEAAGSNLVLLSYNEEGEPVISIVMKGAGHEEMYACMSDILGHCAN